MERIVITGAAGFIGYHLARTLADRGASEIICVDNFLRGERDGPFGALVDHPNVSLIECDLTNAAAVSSLPLDVDKVYHLAALNGTQNFYERPMDVIRHSTLPTIFLADHYSASERISRFIYAGTSESYASTVTRFDWPVPTAEDVPLCIEDPTNPRWSYAASKMHGEVATAQAGLSRGMPFSIIRYHNAYGPRMGDRHVVPDFMERMRDGRYELFGHADTRSFLYVEDAVAATIAVAETAACANEIINIGGEQEITMLELGKAMLLVRGIDAEILLHPSPAGSVKRRAPDIAKLKSLTGFAASMPLEEGLAITARYYLDGQLDGYGAIK